MKTQTILHHKKMTYSGVTAEMVAALKAANELRPGIGHIPVEYGWHSNHGTLTVKVLSHEVSDSQFVAYVYGVWAAYMTQDRRAGLLAELAGSGGVVALDAGEGGGENPPNDPPPAPDPDPNDPPVGAVETNGIWK